MQSEDPSFSSRGRQGLVLPVVLVLMVGLWLLAVGLLSLSVVNQRSTDIGLDGLQAELAVQTAMQEIGALLLEQASNDDFLIVQEPASELRQGAYLHLLEPQLERGQLRYQVHPLFSHGERLDALDALEAPSHPEPEHRAWIRTHPWLDPIPVAWLPLNDGDGRQVARYAFWIEDLESKIDLERLTSGLGDGMREPDLRALRRGLEESQVRELMKQREMLVSPHSMLAAAGLESPLKRLSKRDHPQWVGRLVDPWGDALERHAVVGLAAYNEQPRVPYVEGLSPWVMGQPKRNLNRLLTESPEVAVEEMAQWIRKGLPNFADRAGGFPEDYCQTLAANAIDYADANKQPLIKPGQYRGIDGQPFLSEVVLHLHYQGLVQEEGRWVMKWTLRLFAELWNLGSEAIEGGQARLSYEVNLKPTAIGMGSSGLPFDSPELLDDPRQSTHALERLGSLYLTPAVNIHLLPDQYRFHEFARVDYLIDCEPQLDGLGVPLAEWFDLVELEHEARGLTLFWNGQPVERLARILRDPHGLADFRTDRRRKTAKACIPSLNYGGSYSRINNPGDPRASHYLRALPVGENAYPENISPHCRNIRRRNIYDKDPSPLKTRHYGRVMPSQWADGGHDSATGDFRVTTSDARMPTDPEFWPHSSVPTPQAGHAPQRLSSRGHFQRVTELGRLYDPVMWTPAYSDLHGNPGSGERDTAELLGTQFIWQRPAMPIRRGKWPEVSMASMPSDRHGGGHTLRIGRAEHSRFDRPGMRASDLLDLFHCGQPRSLDARRREGPLQRVAGRVNVNTASREVLRALVHGELVGDSAISELKDPAHDTSYRMAPLVSPWQASEEGLMRAADVIAGEILRARPFATTSCLSHLRTEEGAAVFGNSEWLSPNRPLQWSDSAAEEWFAKIHERTGVRSRNFRLWVVGQTVRPKDSGVEVLANVRRVYTVHLDPGERAPAGEIIEGNLKLEVRHVCEF